MPDLPSGTVTFLFTDIEGSTRLLKQLRDRYADLLAQHQRLLRESFLAHGGREVDTQGDSFFVVFARARDAVLAAAAAQRAFAEGDWPDGAVPKVRMGLHTGEPIVGEDRYVGLGVHRAARIMAAGHGGQVLLSEATAAVLADEELPGVELRALGEHHLKDLDRPERIYQLELDGVPADFPRLKTLDSQPDEATPFAGREGELAEAAKAAVAPRRRRTGSLLAAGALLAAGTATALVLLLGRSDDAGALSAVDANAVGVIDAGGRLTSQVEIGTAPSRVAAGEGAIWVTNVDEGSVSQIDPDEGDLRQKIPVGSGPSGIAVGNKAVWVANGLDGTVSRIDPLKNDVVQTISVGNGPAGVAFGEGSVWVANRADGTVTRIDARTGRVRGTFPAGGGATDVAVGAGAVWVASQTASTIVQLEAASGNAVRSINVGNGPSGVAFGSGSVWAANGLDGTVSRIDPGTGAVTATIPVGDSPNDIVVGGGGVWVSNEFGKTVSFIDPTENAVVRTIELGNLPTGLAVAGDKVWVAVRASGTAHRGGRLVVLGEDGSETVDPALAYDPDLWSALITTNDGLTAFKRVGGSEGGQLVPDLATSLPAPTDGGKTYTFELRPGIRYSNGAPVEAGNIRTAIERLFRLESPGRGFYSRIVGADSCLSRPAGCTLARGISTDNAAGRVTFRLTAPDPDFLYKLALPFAFAVPSHGEAGVQPATGPYMVESYEPGTELRLVRNPRFREWSRAAQPDGYPSELVWRFGIAAEEQVNAVQRGRADVTAGLHVIPPSRLEELRTQYASQFHVNPALATVYLFLNTRVPPFDDERARRAVNYAIDREEVIRLIGGPERGQLTCQVLPPNFPGYRRYCPYTVEPNSAGMWRGPHLAAARRLVAKTPTKGARVTVWWPALLGRPAGAHIVSALRTLGYQASLKLMSSTERHFAAISDSRRRIQAGGSGWIADYPAESGFISVQLRCEAFLPRSIENTNFAQFCDRKIDAEIARAEALQTTDPHAASELWAKIDRQIVDRAPWVPLYNNRSAAFVSERVGNYQHHPQWGVLVDQLWVR